MNRQRFLLIDELRKFRYDATTRELFDKLPGLYLTSRHVSAALYHLRRLGYVDVVIDWPRTWVATPQGVRAANEFKYHYL